MIRYTVLRLNALNWLELNLFVARCRARYRSQINNKPRQQQHRLIYSLGPKCIGQKQLNQRL